MITSSDLIRIMKLFDLDSGSKTQTSRTKFDIQKIISEYEGGKVYEKIDELIEWRVLVLEKDNLYKVNKTRIIEIIGESKFKDIILNVASEFAEVII